MVDIFNRVNSGGTKLSKGDLALAKICAEWSGAREVMKGSIERWMQGGYKFTIDWLLRNVNAVTTSEASFGALHDISAEAFEEGLDKSVDIINRLLDMVDGRLGLDHHQVLFGAYAFPVMARYISVRCGKLPDAEERDALLYWYVQSAMWGRFSGATETVLNRDLGCIEGDDGDIRRLVDRVRVERGDLRVRPEHFESWSIGARFYPMLYLLTRTGEARGLGHGAAAEEGPARTTEPPRVPPHLPQGAALQERLRPAGSKRIGELLLSHAGGQPSNQREGARTLLRGDRGALPRGARESMDPDGPRTLENRALP